jgi:hypothetical protein
MGSPQVMCNFQRFYVCAYTLGHRVHLPWRLEANLVSTLRLPCTRNSSSAIYIHGKESVILCIYPVHLCVCLLRRICIFRMPVQPPCIMNKIVAVIHMRRNLHCVCFSIPSIMYDALLNPSRLHDKLSLLWLESWLYSYSNIPHCLGGKL